MQNETDKYRYMKMYYLAGTCVVTFEDKNMFIMSINKKTGDIAMAMTIVLYRI